MNKEEIFQKVLDAMQIAEGFGGLLGNDYIDLMRDIQKEAKKRKIAAQRVMEEENNK